MRTGRSLFPMVALVAVIVTEPTVGEQPPGSAQVLWQYEAGG